MAGGGSETGERTEGIGIVTAGPERAADIAALHAELFQPAWDAPSVTTLLSQPGAVALLAVARTTVVGFVLARRAADEAEILSIGVRPAMQRGGVGRRLVEALAVTLRAEGVTRLFLEVAADNLAARALYHHAGLREVGRRRAYYMHPTGPADALVLALAL